MTVKELIEKLVMDFNGDEEVLVGINNEQQLLGFSTVEFIIDAPGYEHNEDGDCLFQFTDPSWGHIFDAECKLMDEMIEAMEKMKHGMYSGKEIVRRLHVQKNSVIQNQENILLSHEEK